MPLTAYLRLFADHGKLLSFGFVMAFSSSFGQTYFIGIFGPEIQTEFGLSHTVWGSVYLVGTLASAALVPWTGSLIDRFNLSHYTLLVVLSLVASCVFISLGENVLSLIIAVFLLRHFGQGLASHISITTMARYFDAGRGRAIAVATMGSAAGEALLPFIAVGAIAFIGWRWTYVGAAMLLGLILLPLSLVFLRGHRHRHQAHLTRLAARRNDTKPDVRSWSRAQVLRDRRFYLLLPGLLASNVIVTAMFFHHLNLADAKGWSHTWITGNYVLYAVGVVLTALTVGPLIDRFRAVRILPYMLLPLVLGLAVVSMLDPPWAVFPYMLLIGVNAGIVHTATSAMWPELYGVEHLGSIKSLAMSLTVLGSALGPVIMGGLMDLGMSIETVCLLFAAYSIVGGILIYIALHKTPVH